MAIEALAAPGGSLTSRLVDSGLRVAAQLSLLRPYASSRRRRLHPALRVLVEPSDFTFGNVGDTAMLQIGLARLAEVLPDAEISVLTEDPDDFAQISSTARPLRADGRQLWLSDEFIPIELRRFVTPETMTWMRRRDPGGVARFWRYALSEDAEARSALNGYIAAMAGSDLVVVTGMGGISDAFPQFASELLDTLALALSGGAAIALLGQGIGPLEDPDLRARAATVLRQAALIGLRDDGMSRETLAALGVNPSRIVVTGDDAVELARRAAGGAGGEALGVNLRVATYAGTGPGERAAFGAAIRDLARSFGCPVASVPISAVRGEEDQRSFEAMAGDWPCRRLPDPDPSPAGVIAAVQRCRIVVTGSYHAAVFACASGVPAVCLARTGYYRGKFEGLARQFGAGCVVIDGLRPDWPEALASTARDLWREADGLRGGLLASADAQIEAGLSAYARLPAIARASRAA